MRKYLAIVVVVSIIACGGNEEVTVDDEVVNVIDDELTPERATKAQMIFETIPSPIETASLFETAGAPYNGDATNPMENVDNYVTNSQKALNFGVYGADLGYANIHDQSQESMFYMNCSKKLSDGLGVTAAFDPETLERIEENINNRDSMMTIINDAFWITDAHLKENGQENLSALIITGGWIEGVYLGTQAINHDDPDPELMKKIADQKYSLDNLVELLETYDNGDVETVELKLKTLQLVFDKITEEKGKLNFDVATILEISDVIRNIRTEIIQ